MCGRVATALAIITVLLIISFVAIYFFKKTSINAGSKFPKINCSEFVDILEADELKELAGREFDDW